MASNIEVSAGLSDDAAIPSVGEVYAALSGLDASEASPISSGGDEIAVSVRGDSLVARVQGHDGEWSEQSQRSLLRTLEAIDGVTGAEVVAGGHDAGEDESAGEAAGDDETTPATSLSGVGSGRGETLADAGIETVADVSEAGVDGLVEAGISEGVAENLVDEADGV